MLLAVGLLMLGPAAYHGILDREFAADVDVLGARADELEALLARAGGEP
jgi:hypothetical protein